MVESYMLDKLKQAIGEYAVYAKLIDLIWDGTIQRY
jgi:hypothetical protein